MCSGLLTLSFLLSFLLFSPAMFKAVLLDKECWIENMKLNPTSGLDPDGIRLRAAQGLEAADYLVPG